MLVGATAAVKTCPTNDVVKRFPPVVPVASVMAGPPTEETSTSGVPETVTIVACATDVSVASSFCASAQSDIAVRASDVSTLCDVVDVRCDEGRVLTGGFGERRVPRGADLGRRVAPHGLDVRLQAVDHCSFAVRQPSCHDHLCI